MMEFLKVVAEHRTRTRDELLQRGFHPKVIYAKSLKAAARGYTDYGVAADRPWLTPKGEEYLRR